MCENELDLSESVVSEHVIKLPSPREYVWQVAPVVSVTDQLKVGNLVIVNKLPDLNEMIRKDPKIPNVLIHLGMGVGTETFGMHMKLRVHIENEKTHFLAVAQDLRKKMDPHKISSATGICVYVNEITYDDSRLLMTQGAHVLFNRKVLRNIKHEPRAILGIVTKDFEKNILDPLEFRKLSDLVAETLKNMKLQVFKIT